MALLAALLLPVTDGGGGFVKFVEKLAFMLPAAEFTVAVVPDWGDDEEPDVFLPHSQFFSRSYSPGDGADE